MTDAPAVRGRGSRDVVFTFSDVDTIDDAVNREYCRPPDQALRALVASPRVRRLVVANPWRSPLSMLRRRVRYAGELGESLTVVRPFRWRRTDPEDQAGLAAVYQRWDRRVGRHGRRMDRPVLLTFHPFVAAHAPLAWASRVVFYARDDWTAYAPMREWWPELRRAYALIRERGAAVIAVSSELADRIGAAETLVLPNGVEESVWTAPGPPPREILDLPRPWLTYTGTVNDRVDVPGLLRVASELPGSVLLVGPTPDPGVRASLERHQSVHLLGVRDQATLASIVHASDACLLPHVESQLTRAMSPLKLFEYLASGRPVVASRLPPIQAVAEDMQIVEDGDYVGAVQRALRRGPLDEPARLAMLGRHSWRSRHEQMLDFTLRLSA